MCPGCGVRQPTFQVWGAHGRHCGGRGLAEALKGSLLSRGVVWSPVLLFLLLLVWTHGLQSQLFPVQEQSGYYERHSSQVRNSVCSGMDGMGRLGNWNTEAPDCRTDSPSWQVRIRDLLQCPSRKFIAISWHLHWKRHHIFWQTNINEQEKMAIQAPLF